MLGMDEEAEAEGESTLRERHDRHGAMEPKIAPPAAICQ